MQDLDIDFKLVLNAATYDRLMDQIQEDCALLEALRVMDYSMLLGVHYLSWGPEEWHPPKIKVRAGTPTVHICLSACCLVLWCSNGFHYTSFCTLYTL